MLSCVMIKRRFACVARSHSGACVGGCHRARALL